MSNVPEGAQLSDDGQWWWDGEQWQPVEGTDGSGGEEGAPAFDFGVNGLIIDAEESPVPNADEPLKASFAVVNTGTAAGSCRVTIYVDGSDTGVVWDSGWLEPGQSEPPGGDGYVPGIPAQSEGRHKFEAYCDPPGPGGGYASNEIDIGAAW
ncbi:hypothetical protein [Actinokineospora sp. HUAS TT18]|uniref:hypothetical protein n=1 Tax=Actinokineospora sp. HUAS TT18 TaxID=3447451 RepID=UPI003F522B92